MKATQASITSRRLWVGILVANTRSTVHQKVGDAGREHARLLVLTVIVFLEVNCILVDVLHHVLTNLAKASLGITHGSGAVAVHRAEVTLSVDERIAHSPVLSHTNERAIDR